MDGFQTPAFRQAGPGDLERLLELVKAYHAYEGQEVEEAAARRALAEALEGSPLAKAWLIEVNKQAIGYFILGFGFSLVEGGRDALIDELYLEEEWRGLGCGKAALIFAEEAARADGCVAINLFVEPHNETAQAIYAAKGYAPRPWRLMVKRLD